MTINEFVADALNREQQMLHQAVEDLTAEELVWRPGPEANSIGWTLWHMFRVEDMWFQFFIQRQLEIWERDGWHEKFGLPTRDNGFGHSPEQVANFPALDPVQLWQYAEAVRSGTLEYLQGLAPGDLEFVPREQRPEVSVGVVLRQITGELYQHLGQIAYLKGLQRGFADALPPNFGAP